MWKQILAVAVSFMMVTLVRPYASAQSMNTRTFIYNGGEININENLISWEPSHAVASLPGFHLHFYGHPDANAPCTTNQDGPTLKNFSWSNLSADTGIPESIDKWTPCCSNWQGITSGHVNMSPVQSGGGIGLHTLTGRKPFVWDSSLAFWMPYPATGDRHGANKHIQGTFAMFRFNPSDEANLLRPWSGNSANNDLRRVAFRTTQKVVKAIVQGSNSQVQQQLQFTILNLDCHKYRPAPNAPCQFQIVIPLWVLNTSGSYSNRAQVYADAAQGGIPVIFGNVNTAGTVTTMDCPNYGCGNDVFTSWGEPTLHTAINSSKVFQIEISFNQLLKILSVTAAAYYQKSYPQSGDLISLYGYQYNNPSQWILLDAGFSQEAYNDDVYRKTATIGGNLTALEVYALPF